jgi:tRNA(Ile)-lysidine synthase
MSALVSRVRSFIREHDLAGPESLVLVAVSGGSDSIALLHVLRELHNDRALRLTGVAHFNHQLRPTADDDERLVKTAAARFDLPFVSDREDVAARAKREKRSIEYAARASRHAFLERARRQLTAHVIAVGHTRDDQAETFLLRLLRGAGPRGLSGMHPRSGAVIRPLLESRRHELRDWLALRKAAGTPCCDYVDDATNDDVLIVRNRIRVELLPLLAARFNPSIVDTLADEAALMQQYWSWVEESSAPSLQSPETLDVTALRALPPPILHAVVWRAMSAVSAREISYGHVAAVVRLITAEGGTARTDKTVEAPGLLVQRIGSKIVLKKRTGSQGSQGARGSRGSHGAQTENPEHLENPANPANFFWYELSIPGERLIPETGMTVSADDYGPGGVTPEARAAVGNGVVALVRRDLVRGSLAVRNRRPGDRFRPPGLGGSKKLQDLFVDRKLPRNERDAVPLVVDETDRIVWVAGYGIDEAFQVTDSSQAVLVLRLTRA